MRIEYSANNSGGRWWLADEDWKALEEAGWEVQWGGLYFCHSKYSTGRAPEGKPEPCADGKMCHGHRRYDSYEEAVAGERWLGAIAKGATREAGSPAEAIREFERATGQDASDEGCNCCGPPHSFNWRDEDDGYGYASGSDCLSFLYERVPGSLREAARLLNGSDE